MRCYGGGSGYLQDIFKAVDQGRFLADGYLSGFPVRDWSTKEAVHRREKRSLAVEAMEEVS